MTGHSRHQLPLAGVALMLEPEFMQAAYPLFAGGEVEAVEWSFDVLWGGSTPEPEWLPDLLTEYSQASRLLGHGVTYSMFTADSEARSVAWADRLRRECHSKSYRHITEHFGFMIAGDFHRGAPLPVPLTAQTLRLGQDRLARLAEAAEKPVGLENLAFAFGEEDVRNQGEFLDRLLDPIDGFLLLDLHNIYCQACNFDQPAEQIIASYPLTRVRELHVSGGSWSEALGSRIRRDTHDEAVPEELFSLLDHTLRVCPNVEAVIFEHLGNALPSAASHSRYQDDFRRIARQTREFRTTAVA